MDELVFEYIPTESEEQQAVFQWAWMVGDFVPDLKMLHHVPLTETDQAFWVEECRISSCRSRWMTSTGCTSS